MLSEFPVLLEDAYQGFIAVMSNDVKKFIVGTMLSLDNNETTYEDIRSLDYALGASLYELNKFDALSDKFFKYADLRIYRESIAGEPFDSEGFLKEYIVFFKKAQQIVGGILAQFKAKTKRADLSLSDKVIVPDGVLQELLEHFNGAVELQGITLEALRNMSIQ